MSTSPYYTKLKLGFKPDIVSMGHKAVGYALCCPDCFDSNTYFSLSEQAWTCFGCGTVFMVQEPSSEVLTDAPAHGTI